MATDKEQSILTEAQGLVHGDRNSDHGHLGLTISSRTAAIWTVLLGGSSRTARASSRKTLACAWSASNSRQINQPKRDNLTDAAGYCRETVRMVIDERARRENKNSALLFGGATCESDEEKEVRTERIRIIDEEVGDRVIERLFPDFSPQSAKAPAAHDTNKPRNDHERRHTEYKDAFDAAAQPSAVETAEEPRLRGSEANLRTEPRSSKPTLPTTRPQRRLESKTKMDEMASSHRQRPDSAHAQSAANAVGRAGTIPARIPRANESKSILPAEAERRK